MNKRHIRIKYRKHLPEIVDITLRSIAVLGVTLAFWVVLILIAI